MTERSARSRWKIFGLLCLVASVVITIAVQQARVQHAVVVSSPAAPPSAPAEKPAIADVRTAATPEPPPLEADIQKEKPPRIFYRYTGLDENYGRLAVQAGPDAPRGYAGGLSCDVAYVGGNRGICLVAKRGVITNYFGKLFDATTFEQLAEFPLAGVPSRSRVSKNGKLAAYTVFLSGHGYSSLDFSTQTVLLDVAKGAKLLDLELDFVVFRDGAQIRETDFNFWGVTFTPDAREFYATLSTGGKHFLVRGDIGARTMTVLHENVECPSLSPDGRRVAYKKRLTEGGRIFWQLQILDLASGKETAIAERRSIDDQLEWLDDAHVLYSVPQEDSSAGGGTDVWLAPVDVSGAPRLYLRQAYSPAIERW